MTTDKDQKIQWLTSQFSKGRIDRRELLGRLVALGATSMFVSGLAGKAVAQGAPKKGGYLRFGMAHGETTDTLDPGQITNGYTTVIAYTITNMLTEEDADGKIVPKLAESWEAKDAAKTWVFKIRKGVEFHNGKTLTAKDVVASINYHRGEKSKSSVKPIVAPMTDVKADGDNVIITLSGGDADIPAKLSNFSFGIYPANDDGTLAWEKGVGTGAYRMKEFKPGVKTVFERNANFWQADRAFFDGGELIAILDPTARQSALAANEVDAIDRVDLKTADLLAKTDGIVVEEVLGKLHYTFPMHTDTAPFKDRNVRLALKHAIDRQAFLDSILFGHGKLGNDQPITPAYRYFAADIEQRAYDPDKAKFYLKEAGLTELKVDLSAAGAAFQSAVDAALLYKENAVKAGIDINVVREPADGYWANVWNKKPWCASYWFGTPTADGIFTQAYAAGGDWNDTKWNNEKFMKLLVEARAELDDAKRAAMYREMQLLIRDDGGNVIPAFANDVFATRNTIRHGKLASNYEVDGRMFFDRWWFA
ncbi:ABC transporter substrate-binding protein [soil metagenome]